MDTTRELSSPRRVTPVEPPSASGLRPVSILFEPGRSQDLRRDAPAGLADLNLDVVITALTTSRTGYELASLFTTPLPDPAAVTYRHDVFRDLDRPEVESAVREFSDRLEGVRRQVLSAARDQHGIGWQRRCWYAEAIAAYCRAARDLAERFESAPLRSTGLRAVRDHLVEYVASTDFTTMASTTQRVLDDLQQVRFGLRIRGAKVTVSRDAPLVDYSVEVTEVFDRFRRSDTTEPAPPGRKGAALALTHVEAQVVDRVALLWPAQFDALTALCTTYPSFADPVLDGFQRDAQFYLAYLDYISPVRKTGLSFCYPQVLTDERRCQVLESFDLALAHKLSTDGSTAVTNDISLTGQERILVVTGPNHGGKTTFARMVGQVHHLAAIGVPIPGRSADVPLADEVFTHFERAENLEDDQGKLEDDLRRLHHVLDSATPRSVVILNEVFTSTTLADARAMGAKVIDHLTERGTVAVYVTFVDELARLNTSTVSLVSQVRDEDPSQRTFKIVRQPANGIAHAIALAGRYGLTREQLRDRITP